MSKNAVLSCIDPQLAVTSGEESVLYSSKVILDVVKKYNKDSNLSENMLAASIDAKIYYQDGLVYLKNILNKHKINKKNHANIIHKLYSGNYPHIKPFNYKDLIDLGFDVKLINNQDSISEIYERYLQEESY